jgi:hypothetical protein
MTVSPANTLAEHEFPEVPDQAKLLDSIFSAAIDHDKKCQRTEDDFYRMAGYRGGPYHNETLVDSRRFEDLEGKHRWAMVEVCATIAAAALRRVSAIGPFAREIVDHGLLHELGADQFSEFMRPIFEESGIGERFEIRQGYEVFEKAEDYRPT